MAQANTEEGCVDRADAYRREPQTAGSPHIMSERDPAQACGCERNLPDVSGPVGWTG